MKRVLFIDSHLGSGSDALYGQLELHPRVQGYRGLVLYENPSALLALTSLPHKCPNQAAVYMDEIVHNHTVLMRTVADTPYHIFVLREPEGALGELMAGLMWAETAATYYQMRLRRLVAMGRRARRGLVLTHEDLCESRGYEAAARLLRLEGVGFAPPGPPPTVEVPYRLVVACQDHYERSLYALRSMGLLSATQGERGLGAVT